MAAFNMSEYTRDNLITTYKEGSFTAAQVAIYASNYFARGVLTEEDFQKVTNALAGIEEDPETKDIDYNSMTVADLRELAKAQGISGYSTMTKNELIVLLGGSVEEEAPEEETIEETPEAEPEEEQQEN